MIFRQFAHAQHRRLEPTMRVLFEIVRRVLGRLSVGIEAKIFAGEYNFSTLTFAFDEHLAINGVRLPLAWHEQCNGMMR